MEDHQKISQKTGRTRNGKQELLRGRNHVFFILCILSLELNPEKSVFNTVC